jgi:SSS family solute:Na+ symporter
MVASFLTAVGFEVARRGGAEIASHHSLLITVGVTTVVWITAAFLGTKTEQKVLESFYRLVRPAGPGWAQVRAATGLAPSPDSLPTALVGWVAGIFLVYAALFGVGAFLFGRTGLALFWAAILVVSAFVVAKVLQALWRPAASS